jgi:hypothetical protein
MYEEALILFKEMNANGIMVDEVVVLSVLSARSRLVVLLNIQPEIRCIQVK